MAKSECISPKYVPSISSLLKSVDIWKNKPITLSIISFVPILLASWPTGGGNWCHLFHSQQAWFQTVAFVHLFGSNLDWPGLAKLEWCHYCCQQSIDEVSFKTLSMLLVSFSNECIWSPSSLILEKFEACMDLNVLSNSTFSIGFVFHPIIGQSHLLAISCTALKLCFIIFRMPCTTFTCSMESPMNLVTPSDKSWHMLLTLAKCLTHPWITNAWKVGPEF